MHIGELQGNACRSLKVVWGWGGLGVGREGCHGRVQALSARWSTVRWWCDGALLAVHTPRALIARDRCNLQY